MTPAYVDGSAGCQKGVAQSEPGIKVESVSTTISDPKVFTYSENGSRDGFVHNYDASVQITVTGEISGSTGLCDTEFGTAIAIANVGSGDVGGTSTGYFGITAGSFFIDGDVQVNEDRGDALKSITIPFLSCPDITIS